MANEVNDEYRLYAPMMPIAKNDDAMPAHAVFTTYITTRQRGASAFSLLSPLDAMRCGWRRLAAAAAMRQRARYVDDITLATSAAKAMIYDKMR